MPSPWTSFSVEGVGEWLDLWLLCWSFLQSMPTLRGKPPPALGGLGRSRAHWKAWSIFVRPIGRSQRDPALCFSTSVKTSLFWGLPDARAELQNWPVSGKMGAGHEEGVTTPLDNTADLVAFGFLQLI